MGYKVIKSFSALQDNRYVYSVGAVFPRSGLRVTEDRLKELAGSNNRIGVPLIKEELSVPQKDAEDAKTGVNVGGVSEAKKKPQKRRGRNVRTDS